MKITKAMGRACLSCAELAPIDCPAIVKKALLEAGWLDGGEESLFDVYFKPSDQYHLTLAMCAAIAGVKP